MNEPWPFTPAWEIKDEPVSPDRLFLSLPLLTPIPFHLRLEDSASRDVRAFLASHDAGPLLNIQRGGGGRAFNVLVSVSFLRQLAELAEHHAEIEMCMHLHVFSGRRIVLEWYDAFSDNPLFIDGSVSEASVRKFCEALGVEYGPAEHY